MYSNNLHCKYICLCVLHPHTAIQMFSRLKRVSFKTHTLLIYLVPWSKIEQTTQRERANQGIENEAISKVGEPLDGVLELGPGSLDELHALTDAGQSVEGGGQGVDGVGLVWGPLHSLGEVLHHSVKAVDLL